MDRREFGVQAALMLLGGAAITISGCGGGSGSSPTASSASPPLTDKAGTISSNHGHAAVITAAQLGAGGSLELDIRGTASHTHTLSLSASEIVAVRGGATVAKDCTGGSHTHTVTFNG